MSYFEDQYEAWMDSGCEGRLEDVNPDEVWADIISECEAKGHDFKTNKKEKICKNCKVAIKK